MPDLEKVIKGLGNLYDRLLDAAKLDSIAMLDASMVADAITMLKEQEDLGTELTNAVELIRKKNERIKELLKKQEAQPVTFDRQCEEEPGHWVRKGFCPKCHQEVLWMINREYCGFCGQKVKWE